jgi:hypothetical protein
MTERAQEIWETFCGELIDNGVKDSEDVRQGLSTAIRTVADRLCTDWAELKHPYDVLMEIADELEAL